MYELNELHFMFDISIMPREGESMEETKNRLLDVMAEAFINLADHEINYLELEDS